MRTEVSPFQTYGIPNLDLLYGVEMVVIIGDGSLR